MMSVGIYVAALLFIAFLIYSRRSSSNKALNLPPGSTGLPLIGETLQLLIPNNSLDLPPFFKSRFLRYGPVFRTRLIGRHVVVSADMNLNRMIQQQEGRLVELWYLDTFAKVLSQEGEGRINALGDIHKYLRGTTLKHFGAESLKDKLLNQIQEMLHKTLQNWSSQESIEVQQSVFAMTTNFGANLIFGYDGEKTDKKLAEKFSCIAQGFLSYPINIPGTSHHKSLKCKEEIANMIKDAIRERINSKEPRRGDLVDHAIDDLNTREFLTEDFVINIMFSLLPAISMSTSTSTTLVLKFLSENPSALDELMVEHERVMKNKANPRSLLTWDEVKSMTSTLNVINESLRLGGFPLGLFRKVLKDIQFNGYTIPAGWIIMMVTSACHFNPNVYNDPLTFNPSRWKDLAPDVVSKNFMPFGGGIRQCAGAEFAKVFMVTLLHVLVTNYRWTKIKGGEIHRAPWLRFKNGLHIKVVEKE